MAVRRPLYANSTNFDFKEMKTADVDQWIQRAIYEYSLAPSANLVFSASSGNTGQVSDTRLQAGAHATSTTAFPSEAVTDEPSTVTVNYNRVLSQFEPNASIGATTDAGKDFPCYYDAATNQIRAMSLQDMKDTFLHPAVDLMINAAESGATAGTFTISTNVSPAANYVDTFSAQAVYLDTNADVSLYTSGGIPEALDQPTTLTNFYVHKRIVAVNVPARKCLQITGADNLQEFTIANMASLIGRHLRNVAANSTDGFKISYTTASSGAGAIRGSNIVDTKLNGPGAHTTRFVDADDYRAQEFPDGSSVTQTTYNLRIRKD